jgi:hypothetical protein
MMPLKIFLEVAAKNFLLSKRCYRWVGLILRNPLKNREHRMDTIIERRNSNRIFHKATVMIEIRDTGACHYATINNFSGDGMYCGSDCAISPGTVITISLDNPPFKSAPKIYSGVVQRCEKLEAGYDTHLFGLGIKVIEAISR